MRLIGTNPFTSTFPERTISPRHDAAPHPCFTLFDGFHFSLPLIVGAGVFLMTWRSLGLAWGTALAALLTLLSFGVFRYAIPAFVLFPDRHQIGNARVKDQVACYVVTHFRSDKAQGKNGYCCPERSHRL